MAKRKKSTNTAKRKYTKKIDKILADTKLIENKEKIAFIVILAIFVVNMAIPTVSKAQPLFSQEIPQQVILKSSDNTDLLTSRFQEAKEKYLALPIAEKKSVENTAQTSDSQREMYVLSSAYSSTVDQCDASPCITADGFNVCANGKENVLAANFLPMGTKVMIPELFGDRVFTVHDRMNKRYYYKIDIWMTSRERALQYGVRNVKIVILD